MASARNSASGQRARKPQARESAMSSKERKRRSRALQKKFEKQQDRPLTYQPPPQVDDSLGVTGADRVFVQALRSKDNVTPLVTSDVVLKRTAELQRKTKLAILDTLPDVLLHPLKFDAVLVKTEDELRRELSQSFQLIRVEAETSQDLTRTYGWNFEKQYNVMPHTCGPAHQARKVDADGNSTYIVDSAAFKQAFLATDQEREKARGMNFLDIANFSGHSFFPGAIRDMSLVHRLERHTNRSPWDRMSEGSRMADQDWIICTTGDSVSPWHTDYAGYNTCVVGLVKRKIWYVPRGDWDSLRKELLLKDAREANWSRGVSVTEIGPGDCLIMSPGTIHGVYTPEDCMVAGCFFWTVETFARSIMCIRLDLDPDSSRGNDEIGAEQYRLLTYVFENMDVREVWTEEALADVWSEAGLLLEQEGVINFNRQTLTARRLMLHRSPRKAKTKEPPKPLGDGTFTSAAEVEREAQKWDAGQEFFWVCVEWWWSQYKARPSVSSVEDRNDMDNDDGLDGANARAGRRTESARTSTGEDGPDSLASILAPQNDVMGGDDDDDDYELGTEDVDVDVDSGSEYDPQSGR